MTIKMPVLFNDTWVESPTVLVCQTGLFWQHKIFRKFNIKHTKNKKFKWKDEQCSTNFEKPIGINIDNILDDHQCNLQSSHWFVWNLYSTRRIYLNYHSPTDMYKLLVSTNFLLVYKLITLHFRLSALFNYQ